PIKEIGAVEMKIQLHPDVAASVKVFVAQTQEEIDMLVAGKEIKKNIKLLGTDPSQIVDTISEKKKDGAEAADDAPAEEAADAAAPADAEPATQEEKQ
ncbi:MAG: hypothetical protein LBL46_00840, partial [Rickettsiales bacterium]|nr:hypothetical protein [Rickettsiales bacterium]